MLLADRPKNYAYSHVEPVSCVSPSDDVVPYQSLLLLLLLLLLLEC